MSPPWIAAFKAPVPAPIIAPPTVLATIVEASRPTAPSATAPTPPAVTPKALRPNDSARGIIMAAAGIRGST
jgi:hypothetical protein